MLLRDALGQTLRTRRKHARLTLRDVAARSNIALGYLSEIERGTKEISSELLASVAAALAVPLPALLTETSARLERALAADTAAGVRHRRPVAPGLRPLRPLPAAPPVPVTEPDEASTELPTRPTAA